MTSDPAELRTHVQSGLGNAYTLERELSGGGMARVFLANETALGRRVVVKVLAPELAEGLSAERFAREVRLAARLQHPNILPVFTAGAAGGAQYYTMPFVEGESLRVRLDREGLLSTTDAIRSPRKRPPRHSSLRTSSKSRRRSTPLGRGSRHRS